MRWKFFSKYIEETRAGKIEVYEELKRKVKPKLILVVKELVDAGKIFKAF